jgi:adenylate cyclase class 2
MSYEVELKYRLDDHDQVQRRLLERGASIGETIVQEDVYLNHPVRDFAQTNEAFRLRRAIADPISGTSGCASDRDRGRRESAQENRITYKGPRLSGPAKTRKEIEIPLTGGAEVFAQVSRLFEQLGFQTIGTVRKLRIPFSLGVRGRHFEIALDQVDGLGSFVEIETQADTEIELPAAQASVIALADEFGLTEPEPRSYLRMVFQAR